MTDPLAICLLCSAPRHLVGVFMPTDPQAWGAPPNKDRLLLYALCERCVCIPGVSEQVESVIWARVGQGAWWTL